MLTENRVIKRALVSVTDKNHLDSLVKALHSRKVEIISTGGTKKFIEDLGIPVTSIEKVTGNPEAFGGRMKSISFPVTSALLYRRYHPTDLEEARELKIEAIDLVVCNLYPFDKYAGTNAEEDILIENIDIGGPLMLRASAKNYESVAVLSDVSDYEKFISNFNESGSTSFKMRRDLAIRTFNRVAQYDILIAEELSTRFLDNHQVGDFPWLSLKPKETLRYGENPHQWAKIFKLKNTKASVNLVDAEVLQGKELSYNNWVDADAAWRVMSDVTNVTDSSKFIVSIIKHANPCGLAVAETLIDALQEAWNGDSTSSFGGIIAASREIDLECAKFLNEKFIEVVIAPGFSAEALKIFSKKKNVRLMKAPVRITLESEFIVKSISGGLLMQNEDESNGKSEDLRLVSKTPMSKDALELVDFGILACKHLKSNGIALVYKTETGRLTLAGAGMGQPNRLDSLRHLAYNRAMAKGLSMDKMLLISDAFFPFADSVEVCNEVGIRSIVQPGGSIRDDEVIEACNKFGIAMMTTGTRHFRH